MDKTKEINSKKKTGSSTSMWNLHSTSLNNQWVKEITCKVRKYFEINENENTTYENLQDAAKVILR